LNQKDGKMKFSGLLLIFAVFELSSAEIMNIPAGFRIGAATGAKLWNFLAIYATF
jgi:hypothetical protein